MDTTAGPSVLPFTPPETTLQIQTTPYGLGAVATQSPPRDDLGASVPTICFRHSGWQRDRERVHDALVATGQPLNRLADFRQCGKHVYVLQCTTDPGKYMIGGSTCRDRFCLPCGQERSRRIATNVIEQLEKKQARFLTLTLHSTFHTLSHLLDKLTRSFAELRRTKLWKRKVDGGVAFVEIKWIEATQRWHPHFHCLVQGRYLPSKELAKLWNRITGDSSVIDIRFVKDNGHVTHYVAKYASKPMDHSVILDRDRLRESIVALKGKRLCMTFGTWQGVSLTANLDESGWVNLGLLSEIIKDATRGNPVALEALAALRIMPEPDEYVGSGTDPPETICLKCEQLWLSTDVRDDPYYLYE